MAEQLSPGITVTEESPQVRSIAGASTAILLAEGITQRGPHDATLLTSYKEFKKIFGDHTVNGYLSQCVQGFFDEGGQAAYVKRIVHYADITDAATKTSTPATLDLESVPALPSSGEVVGTVAGPWELIVGDTLIVDVDGTGPVTATFDATAAERSAAATAPYTLANNQTLIVVIDGGAPQTIVFKNTEFVDVANATAAEVAAVISAKTIGAKCAVVGGAPVITSDRFGTGSSVNVTGGTANVDLAFTVGAIFGTGDVSDITVVTAAEVKTVVEAEVAGVTVTFPDGVLVLTSDTTGATSSVQVLPTSTTAVVFGLDTATHTGGTGAAVPNILVHGKTDGSYGNLVEVTVEDATDGDIDDFNLTVSYDGDIVKTWPDLSTDAASPRFCETIINDPNTGDDYIALETLVPGIRPVNGTRTLSGGTDGLTGIADTDFVGNSAARTGFHGFNALDEGSLMICPDRNTAAVAVSMIAYCEINKNLSVFPLLEGESGLSVSQVRTYFKTTAGLKNLSEFGGFFYPRIKVLNPNKTVFGNDATVTIPNAGHIAGVFAATDAARTGGVYDAAAGVEKGRFRAVVGLESDYTQEQNNRDLLYPDRINPLVIDGGIITIDGVRTLKGDGNFPTISERRGVIFIETSVRNGIRFAKYRNNDVKLRAEVNRTIDAFLLAQMKAGAFRSQKPSEAYYVDTSDKLNPISSVFAGKLIVAIGLATQKPAEFIEIRVSQDTRAIEASLATS